MISIRAQIGNVPLRIDQFLVQHFPDYTRSFLKKLIISGKIKRNNAQITKPSVMVFDNDCIAIDSFDQEKRSVVLTGYENFFADAVIFDHKDFMVINKPAGIVTHPASENSPDIAVSDLVIAHYPEIALVGQLNRPGIVHRLDKETSGLLLIARNVRAYEIFTKLFFDRAIKKTYVALVKGHPEKSGTVTAPISRNVYNPCMMTTKRLDGRPAHTDYTVLRYFNKYSLVELVPQTGRTHQIRVHMEHEGFPIVADALYGQQSKHDNRLIRRHALHAHKLDFVFDGQSYSFVAPVPDDMLKFIVQIS